MYPVRLRYLVEPAKVFHSVRVGSGKTRGRCLWVLAVLFLIVASIAHHVLAFRVDLLTDTFTVPPVPLSVFPATIRNWGGTNLPMSTTAREQTKRSFADKFLSRRYVDLTAKTRSDGLIVCCPSQTASIVRHPVWGVVPRAWLRASHVPCWASPPQERRGHSRRI